MRVGAAVPRGPTACAVPPGTDVPACADHIAEELIAVVDLAVLLAIRKNLLTEHELVAPVPVFNGHKPRHAGQGDQKAAKAVIIELPVPDLGLYQRPDLLVQHPVILGDQDEIEAQLPVLAEQRHPCAAILPSEVPAVEDDLTLVNDDHGLTLNADLVMLQRVFNQPLGGQLRIVPIQRVGLSFLLRHKILVNREIGNDAAGTLQAADNILGSVKALSAAGRPRIQPNAHSITLIQRRTIW